MEREGSGIWRAVDRTFVRPFLHPAVPDALDYLLAFTVLGLAGLAKKLPKTWGLYCAIIIAALVRVICHTLAGVLFWDTAPWASFVYNITYLGPDTLICIVLAFMIAKPVMRIMKAQ